MSKKSKSTNVKAQEMGRAFAERFTNMEKGPNLAQDIPNAIFEILDSYGVQVPEQVKQRVGGIAPKASE